MKFYFITIQLLNIMKYMQSAYLFQYFESLKQLDSFRIDNAIKFTNSKLMNDDFLVYIKTIIYLAYIF